MATQPTAEALPPTHHIWCAQRSNSYKRVGEALAQQTLDPDTFEVVVVDDGSPEGVGALAEDFAGRLHIRVIRQVNAGPGAARNRVLQRRQGP